MIVKYSDDHQEDLATLSMMQLDPALPLASRVRARKALLALKAGLAHEARVTAALDLELGDAPDWWVFHDLRLIHDGWSAQFDHLLINRHLEFYICESKHVAEGLSLNEYGEFTSFVKGAPMGIPSPFAQTARHQLLLQRVLATRRLPWSLGYLQVCPFRWNSWVLLPNGARVSQAHPLPTDCALLKLKQLPEQLNKGALPHEDPFSLRRLALPLTRLLLRSLIQHLLRLHTPAPPPDRRRLLSLISAGPIWNQPVPIESAGPGNRIRQAKQKHAPLAGSPTTPEPQRLPQQAHDARPALHGRARVLSQPDGAGPRQENHGLFEEYRIVHQGLIFNDVRQ